MKSLSYLIIGCGHFGSLAAEKLLREDPHSRIIVVANLGSSLEF